MDDELEFGEDAGSEQGSDRVDPTPFRVMGEDGSVLGVFASRQAAEEAIGRAAALAAPPPPAVGFWAAPATPGAPFAPDQVWATPPVQAAPAVAVPPDQLWVAPAPPPPTAPFAYVAGFGHGAVPAPHMPHAVHMARRVEPAVAPAPQPAEWARRQAEQEAARVEAEARKRTTVIIRDLEEEVVDALDARAKAAGMKREAWLRNQLRALVEAPGTSSTQGQITTTLMQNLYHEGTLIAPAGAEVECLAGPLGGLIRVNGKIYLVGREDLSLRHVKVGGQYIEGSGPDAADERNA